MNARISVLAAFAVMFLVLGVAPSAQSQVVVYEVKFKRVDGFNLEFFEGGYFVAPALGGTGTFVLTTNDDGRKLLTTSAGTGSFFHGIDGNGKRITVVSATGGDGTTSSANYVAFGDVTGTVEIVTSLATYKIKVAKKLKGTAVVAADESGTTSTGDSTDTTTTDTTTTDTTTDTTTTTTTTDTTSSTTDSSSVETVGFANISTMTMDYDEEHTKKANEKEQTTTDVAAVLVTELKQRGYIDPSDTTDTTTDTGTDTTTTTTTN